MIKRTLGKQILDLAKQFPVISITGPRQSGKTTLAKNLFLNKYRYVSLEDLDNRFYAKEDPRGFLLEYDKYVIIDEAQYAPDLFSYIQGIVDKDKIPGQFILTGSQNFLLLEKISQSLAGRVAITHLFPFDMNEIKKEKIDVPNIEKFLIKGCYPFPFIKSVNPYVWYSNYIKTYIERDIRQIKNVHNLGTFRRFLKMCASRTGQLLDLTSLGNDCGISHNTAKAWLNILEASFIIFLLTPYYKNFNKRLIKSPKLYFYDTGVLCSLLEIRSKEQLKTHYLRGGIFESFIISELIKKKYHLNEIPSIYFYRDRYNHEIDCIFEKSQKLFPIEIKSSKTIASDFFDNLIFYNKLSKTPFKNSYLIYAGDQNQKRKDINIISWKNIDKLDI